MLPTASFPRSFRIDSQYRRCCLYLMVGGWTCTGLAIYLRLWMGNPIDAAAALLTCIFCIAPIALWSAVSSYRLMLDEWGLCRRRLGVWTRWPWEAFVDGKVSIDRGAFTYADRPIWDRWLTTEFLSPGDRAFVQDVIESIAPAASRVEGRRLKPAGEVREVTLGLVIAKKLRITVAGCELLGRHGRTLPWNDVMECRLEGVKQGKHVVYQLTITPRQGEPLCGSLNRVDLPGVTLVPHLAGHDEWVVHLQSLVPDRCWKYLRTWGELRSVEEGEFRRNHWDRQLRIMRCFEVLGWSALPICAAIFVPKMINAWNMPFLALIWKLVFLACAALMIVQPTVLLCCVAQSLRRHFRKQLAANEREIAALRNSLPLAHAVTAQVLANSAPAVPFAQPNS